MQFYDCGDIPLHRSPLLRARNLTDLVLTDCDVSIANTMVNWANLTTLKFSRTLWEEYELEERAGRTGFITYSNARRALFTAISRFHSNLIRP